MPKPAAVKEAIRMDDREALSALGRAGARAAHEQRTTKKLRVQTEEEMLAMKREDERQTEETERRASTNEHIAPID